MAINNSINKTLVTGTKVSLGSDATGDIYRRDTSGTLARLALGAANQVLSVNSAGTDISWSATSVSVNQSLSNLTSTAVNTSVISDTDNTDDLGSSSIAWANVWARNLQLKGSASGQTSLQSSAIASGTIIVPSATDTLVARSTTDTLTNKTLTNPIITTNGSVNLTAAGTLNIATNAGANDITIGGSTSSIVIPGNLQVLGDTVTLNTSTLNVEDTNITVNKGGNDAGSQGAGLTVERTGVSGSFVYKNTSATRFALGALGSEDDVVGATAIQTLSNKTLTTPTVSSFLNAPHNHESAVGGGQLNTNALVNTAVTYAKIQNVTTQRILGRHSGTNGVIEEITIGGGLTLSAGTLSAAASQGGFSYSEQITAGPHIVSNNIGYIASGSMIQIMYVLPITCPLGFQFKIVGKGGGGWRLTQNSGQIVYLGSSQSTPGVTGFWESSGVRDTVEIVCIEANTQFQIISSVGNLNNDQ